MVIYMAQAGYIEKYQARTWQKLRKLLKLGSAKLIKRVVPGEREWGVKRFYN